MHNQTTRILRFVTLFALLAFVVILPSAVAAAPGAPIDIQILTISDWHAQLDPQNVVGVGNLGGAAKLATVFQQERAANPNTLIFTAGDAFGAAPPLSGFFDEVPGVLAMRLMGINADTLGNHNFDKGIAHLQQMVDLAGAPTDASHPGQPFVFLSSNLQNRDDNLSGVKDFQIFEVGGVKVGVVATTNPEAPTLVFPGNFGTIVPTDPVSAANKAKATAKKAGAKVLIAMTHMGVESFDASGAPLGRLIDFANNIGGFDLIVGDHTDIQYQGIHNNALVVENKSKGITYARIHLKVDSKSGKVLERSVTFIPVFSDTIPNDPAVVAMLAPYRTQLAALLDGQIAVATAEFPRGGTPSVERSGEAAIGNLVADAMRLEYGTQLALTNGGGLRSPLPSSYAPANLALRRTNPGYAPGPPYDLVKGDVYTLLPFGNVVVTRTVTGAQLWAALENGVSQINPATCVGADGRFPQISGFKFTFKCSNAAGSRVLSVSLPDDTPILADSTTYTFATNDFVNLGGDSYTVLKDGQGVTRDVMANVVLEYIQAQGTISPVIDGRITKVP